jgi:hypothetical protein
MTLETLQQWVCDELAKSEWLTARHFSAVPESRADAAADIEAAYDAFGLGCLVMTPSFIAQGGQEDGIVPGIATVAIQIVEIPATNRANAGYATSLAAAQHAGLIASTWPGARLAEIGLVDLKDLAADEAVAHQARVEIEICLSIEE